AHAGDRPRRGEHPGQPRGLRRLPGLVRPGHRARLGRDLRTCRARTGSPARLLSRRTLAGSGVGPHRGGMTLHVGTSGWQYRDRLGPVLLQLPPTLRADPSRLDACLSCFPREVRVAVEPRHPSWWHPEVFDVLQTHGAALCWADRESRPVTPLWRTADWGYVRF